MLLGPFAPALSRLADAVLDLVAPRAPAPVSFEGLLDDLFASWPLDHGEMRAQGAPDAEAEAPAGVLHAA